jgi:hypothetical protein
MGIAEVHRSKPALSMNHPKANWREFGCREVLNGY